MQPISSSFDQEFALKALESATTKKDVHSLIERFGYENISPLWKDISPAQRAALTLIRNFPGSTIIHELNQTKRQPDSV